MVRFAHFEFDAQTGYLYDMSSNDQRQEIKLRHKVAELLCYLIEHRDRVVSKDELLGALWQHGEFRDTSLTQSIRDLRKALGDKAQQPHYVRTYPQRGYQWIMPLATDAAVTVDEIPASQDIIIPKTSPNWLRLSRVHWAALTLCLVVTAVAAWQLLPWTASKPPSASEHVVVMPFHNRSGLAELNWVELGLADMLSMVLRQNAQADITSPSQSQMWLLNANLTQPTSESDIRTLLNARQADVAITAAVRLYNQQQVLDFRLIHADGRIQQGSISYPSLPGEIYAVGEQINLLLNPQAMPKKSSGKTFLKLSSESFAEGISALEQQGAYQARRYFSAAAVLDPSDLWPQAYLGRSQVLLGEWTSAEQTLVTVAKQLTDSDPVLAAFVAVWHAELARRRGDEDQQPRVAQAVALAEKSEDKALKLLSYRLAARAAWAAMQWRDHQQWLTRARALSDNLVALDDQADMLFYLGNQANEGLEQSPWSDIRQNGLQLRKALNYYQQLDYRPRIADTQLAIARNYSLPLSERQQALDQAITAYRELHQPYELTEALLYAGFFHLQQHQGRRAEALFREAQTYAKTLGNPHFREMVRFYLAFAMLDQGLFAADQLKLQQAIQRMTELLPQLDNPLLALSTHIFLGWGYAAQGDTAKAEQYLLQAIELGDNGSAPTTHHYAVYSLMKLYLDQGQYQRVLALQHYPVTTRLQARYLARAHSALGEHQRAVATLAQFAQQFPHYWGETDQHQLENYQRLASGQTIPLQIEPQAHSVYCETEWQS
ncbi:MULTISPECIES: winged helix-turn-helix domain-containing protein [unclassified Vibrio]|uniref:winged helix-turn-helix domain-containing protein n=1 Tax=unclassified Vibrio TaxID=2614977 RepID=UPI0013612806|nr:MULTISPECIES: winged helix-turn-helix domain-containing protein [unclassified Vibrio]NAW60253.1 hypothetical protein [Vibrio sp. V36_P2S2PM302]NAX28261.1 hypothetical protein [Vibrio sp. V38_P2S17PM301]NAX30080.1 hypothetical protein [Vibrio sp. V37_P2S8PM304]